MKNVVSFFGTRAEDVLACYRRAAASSQAADRLDKQLRDLRDERSLLHRRKDREIEERTIQLTDFDNRLQQAREQAAKMNVIRDRLTQTLGSFWHRLGISIRRMFSSASPSVQDLRDQLRSVSRKARDLDDKVDKLAGSLESKQKELRRLTIPLESVDFAIASLEQLQKSMRTQVKAQQAEIDREIHDAVRATNVLLLRSKLRALPASIDPSALAIRVLRLKTLLNQTDPSDQEDELATAQLGGDPMQRIQKAVEDGFHRGNGEASGNLKVRGDGRKHVRRTRRRHGSIGRSRTGVNVGSRKETYWERVNVALSGTLTVNFDIPFPRWRSASLVTAIRDEANAWFQVGAAQARFESGLGTSQSTEREVSEITAKIRKSLEVAAER